MKNILYSLIFSVMLSSCFKDYDEDYFQYTKQTVEFDAAVSIAKQANKYYPLLTGITEASGIQSYRVNLFGLQSKVDEEINFRVDPNETTAVEGVDYRFVTANDKVIVPANSSFGYVQIEVLPSATDERIIVLELLGNDHIAVATAYRGIAIPLYKGGLAIPESDIVRGSDFIHAKNIRLGDSNNATVPQFLDMKNAFRYFWGGASLTNPTSINFSYMHSGSNSTNQANLVPPGFSEMSVWGSAITNRFAKWPSGRVTALFYKIPSTATLLSQYNNIQSASDIRAFYEVIKAAPGRLTGERIVRVTSNDLIAYYCPNLDYYAIIKVTNAYTWNEFITMGITNQADFYLDLDYKVQK
jgi:hypothetical protein